EILDGGDGRDTLKLASNVNFTNANASATNNITIGNFEILDLGDYNARINVKQWSDNTYGNEFKKIIGSDKSNLSLYGTNNADTFDLNLDLSEFAGNAYAYGYNGDDTFVTNFEALLTGNLRIDGGNGNDTAKVTATTPGPLAFEDSADNTFATDMFKNIETLNLEDIDPSKKISIDAEAMRSWFTGGSFKIDLNNDNLQSANLTISNTKNGDMVGFELGDHTITLTDNTHFIMQVV
ncbi:MAG: hypothetical protein WC141_04085, partial [Arcobacteraceae bacterium]